MPPEVRSNPQTDVKHPSFRVTVSYEASNALAGLHLQSAHAVTTGRKHQNIDFYHAQHGKQNVPVNLMKHTHDMLVPSRAVELGFKKRRFVGFKNLETSKA